MARPLLLRSAVLLAAAVGAEGTVHGANSPSAFAAAPDWLSALTADPGVLPELQQLADRNELQPLLREGEGGRHAFAPDWQNLALDGPAGWRSLELLNKGRFDAAACALAPTTCRALSSVLPRLMPTQRAPNVGCRLYRLAPGAALRPHRGPGGRLVSCHDIAGIWVAFFSRWQRYRCGQVAHLGIRIPAEGGATLTVEGDGTADAEVRAHEEGRWLVFDDERRHHAANGGATPRYVLHLTFPDPSLASDPVSRTMGVLGSGLHSSKGASNDRADRSPARQSSPSHPAPSR